MLVAAGLAEVDGIVSNRTRLCLSPDGLRVLAAIGRELENHARKNPRANDLLGEGLKRPEPA